MNKEGLTAAACTVGIAIPKGSYLYIQELVMLIAVHSSRCRSVLCCAAHSTWLSGLHIFLGHRVNLAAISKGPCRPLPLDKGKDSTFVPLSQCKAVCLMWTSFCLTVEMDMALKKNILGSPKTKILARASSQWMVPCPYWRFIPCYTAWGSHPPFCIHSNK